MDLKLSLNIQFLFLMAITNSAIKLRLGFDSRFHIHLMRLVFSLLHNS